MFCASSVILSFFFFCRERAMRRSCSRSLLNTWFTLHSLMHNGIILFGGGAVPILFQIMWAPQFFFAKFQKKICVEYLHIYGNYDLTKQTKMEGKQSDTYLRQMRASSGPWVSIAIEMKRNENEYSTAEESHCDLAEIFIFVSFHLYMC